MLLKFLRQQFSIFLFRSATTGAASNAKESEKKVNYLDSRHDPKSVSQVNLFDNSPREADGGKKKRAKRNKYNNKYIISL